MKLYLEGESVKGIGYTPDWLQINYINKEGDNVEITLDIQGTIHYDDKGINCSVSGDLIPWSLLNLKSGKEVDLSEIGFKLSNEQYPLEEIINNIVPSEYIVIGVYPCNDTKAVFKEAECDTFKNCKGVLDYNDKSFAFDFIAEVNV